jgi:hypothetical protein
LASFILGLAALLVFLVPGPSDESSGKDSVRLPPVSSASN